jgi:hypothetical protein
MLKNPDFASVTVRKAAEAPPEILARGPLGLQRQLLAGELRSVAKRSFDIGRGKRIGKAIF